MQANLLDGKWSSSIARAAEVADLETTARQFGAIKRVRKSGARKTCRG